MARAPANLVWNAAATLSTDQAVQVQAVFTGAGGPSNANTLTLDQKSLGQSYATAPVGPGTVSLFWKEPLGPSATFGKPTFQP